MSLMRVLRVLIWLCRLWSVWARPSDSTLINPVTGSLYCVKFCENPASPVVAEPINLNASESCWLEKELTAVGSKEALPLVSNVIPRSARLLMLPEGE